MAASAVRCRFVSSCSQAIVFAYLRGKAGAKAGLPPFFTGLFTNPECRRAMLRDCWKALAKVFLMTITIDMIYQFIMFRWIYSGEALAVALILACIPYVIARGVVNRLLRLRMVP